MLLLLLLYFERCYLLLMVCSMSWRWARLCPSVRRVKIRAHSFSSSLSSQISCSMAIEYTSSQSEALPLQVEGLGDRMHSCFNVMNKNERRSSNLLVWHNYACNDFVTELLLLTFQCDTTTCQDYVTKLLLFTFQYDTMTCNYYVT